MSQRITNLQLETKLRQINTTLGTAVTPYTEDGGFKPNPGNVHIDGNATGYSIDVMSQNGTGTSPAIGHGRYTKREILLQLEAYHAGILAGRVKIPR